MVPIVSGLLCSLSCRHSPDSYDEILQLYHHGEDARAIELSEKQVKRFKADSNVDQECRFRLLQTEILLYRDAEGDARRANLLLEIALGQDQNAGPLGVTSRRLKAYNLIQFIGDPKSASKLLEQASQLASSLSLPSELAPIGILQARILAENPERAEEKTRAALQLAITNKDPYWEGQARHTIGRIHLGNAHYDKAIPFFQQSREIAAREGIERLLSTSLLNLGICYAFLGDFDETGVYLEQAEALLKRLPSVGTRTSLVGTLGNVWMLKEDPARAIRLYRRALSMAASDKDRALWARNLAAALIENRDWEEAAKVNSAVPRLDPAASNGAKLNEGRIAMGRGRYQEATALLAECIRTRSTDPSDLWEAHAGLAEIHEILGHRKLANEHFEKALSLIETTVNQRSGDEVHQMTYLSRLMAFYRAYVHALVEQGESNRALRVVESSRAHILANRLNFNGKAKLSSSGVSDYQQLARLAHSTLLSYWLAPNESYLWAINATKVQRFRLPASADIESLIKDYRVQLLEKRQDPLAGNSLTGHRLYDILVAPAEQMIPAHSSVIIVADGALHFLNFETLLVYGEAERHYWLDDVILSNSPSLDLLTLHSTARNHAGSMLVIGDAESNGAEFSKLANASLEIKKVLSHFASQENRVFTGPQATPAAYQTANPGRFSLIHFSAHAIANQRQPLESFIVLSSSDNNFKLYARDVMSIPLSASLVTISACHAAGGRSYAGEGLVGFVWAFMKAGAGSVIAGLWEVTDDLTPEMMDTLYSEIQAGKAPSESLRAAKLSMVHGQGATRKPWYWAPFQIYIRSPYF